VRGEVDEAGRALLKMNVGNSEVAEGTNLVMWVDTAFDGELVLSNDTIRKLRLEQSSAVEATLADGTRVVLETFECWMDWFGQRRAIEVIANDGRYPLLGIGLLKGRKLIVDYTTSDLTLE